MKREATIILGYQELMAKTAAMPSLNFREWNAYLRLKYSDYPSNELGQHAMEQDVETLRGAVT